MPRISSSRFLPIAAAISCVFALAFTAPASAQTIGEGTFVGKSGHATSGGVAVNRSGGGYSVQLGADFSFDGAPDPKVGFGRGGTYDRSSTLAPLASNTGAQSYKVPSSVDAEAYDEVYLWCEQYAVPLGVAKIK
ncbi:MAG: twin-arginine translocation pathway signal protein [Rhizobiales bacterium]|nr:twin-arginine translocation pathway signal protein [Hyphomicrobiales bacterium]